MSKSMRDQILDYYLIMLAIGWCEADEDGNISLVQGDEKFPATISGKRVVLPTRDQMKNKDWEHRIGFHPLRESFNNGISEILSNMRDLFVQRLNTTTAYLMQELIDIGRNTEGQKDRTAEQNQVLNALTKCSDTTASSFNSLQKKTRGGSDTDQFVSLFIKKGGMVRGSTYGRAAIVTFPIYQKLVAGEEKINGVKILAKDRDMLMKLFKFIFPSIDEVDGYNVGVNSKNAPWMEALMRGTIKVATDLVNVSEPYLPIVQIPYLLQFPEQMHEWITIFDDKDLTQRLADSIPNLTGNYTVEEERVEAKEAPRRDTTPVSTTVAEVRKEEPAPVRKGGLTSISEFFGNKVLHPAPEKQVPVMVASTPTTRSITNAERDRQYEQARRDEEDRLRRERDREEAEDREIRRKRREEDERRDRERRDRERDEDRDRDRDRGRGRDDRDYDRDYDRDRDRDYDRDRGRGRTGDFFDDNPVLRENLRDEERDRGGRDRDRDRGRGRGNGNRVYDIRDGGRSSRDRDRDRYDEYDDRDRLRRRR